MRQGYLQPLSLLSTFATGLGLALATSCGGQSGSCVGTDGIIDECKADWTRDECDEWDEQEVNGAEWNWNKKDCDDLGYTVECSDGTYLRPEDADAC